MLPEMDVLFLKQLPEEAGDYTFTIHYKETNGKHLTKEIGPVHLEAR